MRGMLSLVLSSGVLLYGEHCATSTFTVEKLPREKKRVSPCGIRTIYIPRSQGSNMARYLVGWKEYLPTCDGLAWGNWSFTTEYSHSRDGDRIAQYLFGSTQLHFSGSQVPNRNCRDLLADYFGLSTTFEGSIAFKPRIDNVILDMNYYLGLDTWCPGLYFRFNLPVVVTRWDLGINCREKNNVVNQQSPFFPACYMSSTAAEPAISIQEALSGDFIFGDMDQPISFGKLPCRREHKTGVPQLDFIFGYNWCADVASHAGLYLIVIAPAGNVPRSHIVFEPIVGTGRLWEIGPGISAHVDLMRYGNHLLSFYINGYLSHQFKKFQRRSFDLIGHGPLSRYMLLKEFDKEGNYTGSLINAIDFSTRAVRVGGSAKLDLAMKLSYYYDRWGLDVGYNVYARSKEKLRLQESFHPSDLNNRRFGIKGTEGVCYRILDTATGDVVGTEKLNSVQQRAQINRGGPVSNPTPIVLAPGETAITWDSPTTQPLKDAVQSTPPIIITTESLDLISGTVPHQLTHKFFAHLSYTAGNRPWEPQIGIGGEIEYDGREHLLAALNQWGFWVKIGVSF